MPRETKSPKSTENAYGHSDVPEYPEEELLAVSRAYRVPIESARAWAEYDRACSIWRQRCLCLLPVMLGTPDAYVHKLAVLKARKDKQPVSQGWMMELRAALDDAIDQLMHLARDGQSAHSLALEINAELERNRRHPIVIELAMGGWLPRPPMRPDCRTRPRDPVDEATRQANAEKLAASFFDDDAPEPEHDGRARAAGDA